MPDAPLPVTPAYTGPTASAPGAALPDYTLPSASAPVAMVADYTGPTAGAPGAALPAFTGPTAEAPVAMVAAYTPPEAGAPGAALPAFTGPSAAAPVAMVAAYTLPSAGAPGAPTPAYTFPTAGTPGVVSVYVEPVGIIPAVAASGMLKNSSGLPPVYTDSISLVAASTGVAGNGIQFVYGLGGAGPAVESVVGTVITYNVTKPGEGLLFWTAAEIAAAINSHPAAGALVVATAVGAAVPTTNVTLSGGVDAIIGITPPLPILP